MMNDNWGSRGRIGIFVVGNEVVPEAEWWAMVPTGVSVHAARVTARAPWAQWAADGRTVVLTADLERGATQLAAMRLSAVVVAHSSSSVLGGPGWDDAVAARLSTIVGDGALVTTNGADCTAALRALGSAKPFVVLPPWFDEAFALRSRAYLAERNLDAAGHLIHKPEAKWSAVRHDELYRAFMHIEQRTDILLEQIVAACPASADAVLIAGTGLRCVGIIDALETALRRPVVTANQASLWRCLKHLGLASEVRGYGRLFAATKIDRGTSAEADVKRLSS